MAPLICLLVLVFEFEFYVDAFRGIPNSDHRQVILFHYIAAEDINERSMKNNINRYNVETDKQGSQRP